jgi:hypothetical protein
VVLTGISQGLPGAFDWPWNGSVSVDLSDNDRQHLFSFDVKSVLEPAFGYFALDNQQVKPLFDHGDYLVVKGVATR